LARKCGGRLYQCCHPGPHRLSSPRPPSPPSTSTRHLHPYMLPPPNPLPLSPHPSPLHLLASLPHLRSPYSPLNHSRRRHRRCRIQNLKSTQRPGIHRHRLPKCQRSTALDRCPQRRPDLAPSLPDVGPEMRPDVRSEERPDVRPEVRPEVSTRGLKLLTVCHPLRNPRPLTRYPHSRHPSTIRRHPLSLCHHPRGLPQTHLPQTHLHHRLPRLPSG
jgi:hypothetical protein